MSAEIVTIKNTTDENLTSCLASGNSVDVPPKSKITVTPAVASEILALHGAKLQVVPDMEPEIIVVEKKSKTVIKKAVSKRKGVKK